jgi:PAS domain S-box-containing protein
MAESVPSAVLVSRLRWFTKSVSIFSTSVGCVVLVGWFVNMPSLKTVIPGLASMKANSAICIVLCGLSLWFRNRNTTKSVDGKFVLDLAGHFALAVTLVALATLVEYVFHWNLGIDQLLFRDIVTDGHSPAGRMSPPTATCFLALGFALMLSPIQTRRGIRPSQFFSFIPALVSLVSILGYFISLISIHRLVSLTGVALHTAISLFLISVATFLCPPDRGLAAIISSESLGGVVLRRLIPPAFLVPIVVACIRMEGQRLGLYGTEFGIALLVTVNVAIFTFVIYLSGAEISTIAAEREESERALRTTRDGFLSLNYTFGSVIDACPLPIITLDNEHKIQVWNRAAEQLLGWSFIQVRGRSVSLVPEERIDEFQTIVEILAQGNEVSGIETVFQRRDDSLVTVTVWGAPITFGLAGTSGCVLILEDAAMRKQLEHALRHPQVTE